jgi:zinc transporter 2
MNLNVKAALIHVIGDLVQSIGVLIAAIVIYCQPSWHIADPICTFLFSILVVATTVPILRDCLSILLEQTPGSVNIADLSVDLETIQGVVELHDLHVWSANTFLPL